jgi:epidermal growth factor receptor substrate 15
MDFTEDPFRDYRYEDPFDIEDPFENEPLLEIPNPKLSKSPVAPRPPSGADEEKQVAWAAADSVRVEEERKQRLQQQEQADLEFALALSRSEATAGGK